MLEFFAVLAALAFAAAVTTQLVVPGWQGRPLFPALRPSERRTRQRLAAAADELALARAEQEAARLRLRVQQTKRETEREELSEFDEQLREAKKRS